MSAPSRLPRAGDEQIVLDVLALLDDWVNFTTLESYCSSRSKGGGLWNSLKGQRLVTTCRRLKRAGKIVNRAGAWGNSDWKLS